MAPLCERFHVSLSVVREALTRLAEQRLVLAEPQLGFSVIELRADDLLDLTDVRVQIEGMALKQAIERADLSWETSVVAAIYALGRTPQTTTDDAGEMTDEWSIAHAHFHRTLAQGCGSPLLMEIREGLYDASEVYRRWAQPITLEARDVHGEHTAIANAALARDSSTSLELLEKHIRRTSETLLDSHLLAERTKTGQDDSPA
jgi:DNA-binding GntR family transcriptional regulator